MQYCDGFSAPYFQSVANYPKKTPRQTKESHGTNTLTRISGPSLNKSAARHGKTDTLQFSGSKSVQTDTDRYQQLTQEITQYSKELENEKKPQALKVFGGALGGLLGLKGSMLTLGSDGFALTTGGAAAGATAVSKLGRKLGLLDENAIHTYEQEVLRRQNSCERLQKALNEGEELRQHLETMGKKAKNKVEVNDHLDDKFTERDYQDLYQGLHHDYYEVEEAAKEARTHAGRVAGFQKNYEKKFGEPLGLNGVKAVFRDLQNVLPDSTEQKLALRRLQAFAKINPEQSNQILKVYSQHYEKNSLKQKLQIALIEAAMTGDLKTLRQILKKSFVEPDYQNHNGDTALIQAAIKGRPQIAQALLEEYQAKPDLQDSGGGTALIWAAFNSHPEIVRMLLEKKAMPDLQDQGGDTALTWAVNKAHAGIVQMLLAHDANPVLKNKVGKTARMLAEEKGHTKIADMLKRAEAEWEASHSTQVSSAAREESAQASSSSHHPKKTVEALGGRHVLPISSTAATSPVKSSESDEEERSPAEIVMSHYRKKKPLTEYSGDQNALLDQATVDYMALRLKDDLEEGDEKARLKTKVRLGAQYGKETPREILAFWDKVCQGAVQQTAGEFLGVQKNGLACIAGMDDLKKKIRTSFVNPYRWHSNPDQFRKPDGTLPNIKLNNPAKGLLLYGLEGNGKSFLAEKLAEELDRPYITLKPSDIGSKWHGESEKAIRSAFEKAEEQKPSFLIIDEIDSFLSKKEGMQHADVKLINEMMTQLESAPKKGITVIGTTNHPDKLESAAIRDGRFSVQMEVPPPDKASRLAMWNMFLRETTADGSLPFTELEREELAQITRGCSTARIKNLVEQAAEHSIAQFKDLDLDIIKDLIHEKGPSYDADRMARYDKID